MALLGTRNHPRIICCCLLLICANVTYAQQGGPPKPPSAEENRELIKSLDDEIADSGKLITERESAVARSLALKYGKAAAPPDVSELIKVFEAAVSGAKARDAYDSSQYAESVYISMVAILKILGGPAGIAAGGTDLLRTLAETWLILRYQSNLIDQRWNLAQAIQYASSRIQGTKRSSRESWTGSMLPYQNSRPHFSRA